MISFYQNEICEQSFRAAGLLREGGEATITTRWYINSGDSGGGKWRHRHINGAITVLTDMAHRSSILKSSKESSASSALGCAGGDSF